MVMEMGGKGKGGYSRGMCNYLDAVVYWLSFHHSWFKKV